ncbi:hypothetical protein M9H77_12963 [Catharanthus roseus]|uniref:Uncharacterized protein n=1 Tax=Catharanthus roseus TaxID=4058 RepID=A0ACC0BJ06_CATRO|nr:hypothetical protein M9H77_12963 [Catharanthus roseus]
MEEDRNWMYRRTIPGVMGISSEFQLGVNRFHTQKIDFGSLTYNCGVRVKGDYLETLNEIIEILRFKYKLVELHIKKKYAGGYDLIILSQKVKQVTYVPHLTPKRRKSDWWAVMKSRPRISDVPLVDVLFQEDVDIAKTSSLNVDVQDIGTLVNESGELESVDIRRRSSIVDEDDEEVKWESNEEEEVEEEEIQPESNSET